MSQTKTSDIKDPEIRAMGVVMDVLEPLDEDARRRVLAVLVDKYGPTR